MNHHIRFFKIGTEWNVIHLPEKPNGFGIFIIGDKHNFVNENTSFWNQHTGRSQLVTTLLNEGYTIFYSNLYNENWGSPKAVALAKLLCHIVLKNEILNHRLHIIAEGMGALIALQLMNLMKDKIRSVALINPCLNLEVHRMKEKESKFFYKRFMKEIAHAYEIRLEEAENQLQKITFYQYYLSPLPIKIWQSTGKTPYTYETHTKVFQEERKKANLPTSLAFHLPEKKYSILESLVHFFYNQEQTL